jgi:hypothetical protein
MATSSHVPSSAPSGEAALKEMRAVFIELRVWPTHIYLEQTLDEGGADLNEVLSAMPVGPIGPDLSWP